MNSSTPAPRALEARCAGDRRRRLRVARACVSAPSTGRALLAERAHSLAEVLGGEAGLAQLDQLPLHVVRQRAGVRAQGAQDALVAGERERGVGGDLGRHRDRGALELGRVDHVRRAAPSPGRAPRRRCGRGRTAPRCARAPQASTKRAGPCGSRSARAWRAACPPSRPARAMRMSHVSASSRPPPIAWPFSAATTG